MCFGNDSSNDTRLETLAPRPANLAANTPQPPEPEMTRREIHQYLQHTARYLSQKRQRITVVAVGGVLSTMVLGARNSTHDVDIFNEGLTVEQVRHLAAAIRAVARKFQLDDQWFNSQTTVFVPRETRRLIYSEALEQNDVVFEEGGLKMVAAPWMYSFASKLHRIAGGGMQASRRYDAYDAAAFLSRHLNRTGRSALTMAQLQSSLLKYHINIAGRALQGAITQVNNAARQRLIV